MSKSEIENEQLRDQIVFDLCRAYPTRDGNLLLRNTRNFQRALVTKEVYVSIVQCTQFQTIDKHTTQIIGRNPSLQEQQPSIRQMLQSMLENGMMLSANNKLDSLKNNETPASSVKNRAAPVVAIMTCERPEALERLLKSIATHSDTMKSRCLYVVDDSRKTENIAQNQAVVKKLQPQIESEVYYVGQTQQKSLLSKLIKKLPEHENAIRFLADQSRWHDHWTSGLSRNLAMLLSCGHHLIMLDDDVICDAYNPSEPRSEITFSDDPREAHFYRSDKDWASHHKLLNINPINSHMQCLGMTFSEALSILGQDHLNPAGLSNATALIASELQSESQVLVTECGTLGCPGSGNNTWLPDMASNSLKSLIESETKTHNALNYRMVWSGRNHPHFAPRSNMSPITGLDNREMLPPYFPIFRGEDKLFGLILDFIIPSSVTLDYPWAVPHIPIPQREWSEKDRDFTLKPSFPMFFHDKLLEQKSCWMAQTPEDRLEALAACFSNLATASVESKTKLYRDSTLRANSDRLVHFSKLLLSANSLPSEWRAYLEKGFNELKSNMEYASRPDFPLKGLPHTLEGTELIEFWNEAWAGFAASLIAWPKIREAAMSLVQDQSVNAF
jgi:hypothetical protein